MSLLLSWVVRINPSVAEWSIASPSKVQGDRSLYARLSSLFVSYRSHSKALSIMVSMTPATWVRMIADWDFMAAGSSRSIEAKAKG